MKNVVQVVVGSRDVIRAPALWRYDREQYIEISGLDLPASYMAEMSNAPTGDAEQYLQTSATIHVPSKFLTSTDPVYIWLTFVDEEGRTTRREIICPVTNRGEPIDAVPTPEEQTAIEEAVAQLTAKLEEVEELADHIDETIAQGIEDAMDGMDGILLDLLGLSVVDGKLCTTYEEG